MTPQQIAQFQNQLLSMEEVVTSNDNKITISINGQCRIQNINFAENITIAEIKSTLPSVINQGLTQMGQKVQQLLMIHKQIV
ncbi:YbaB/EbfC family nucleoid-associated protein [Flectobacillus major]|uniref:YbaB/EbfC family nucleoid-associated protein n=1 Tax=Flectobacillus major TaxID=103 RepID=UPI0003FC55FA|nr:YbaB/EbfC family nucleoid-associated protein [Flectobacillus major]